MTTIRAFNIEGLKPSKEGYEVEMYTFQEMVSDKYYDRDQLDADTFTQNMSNPVGWVIQSMGENGKVFVSIENHDQFEYVDNHLYMLLLYEDLEHSGILN